MKPDSIEVGAYRMVSTAWYDEHGDLQSFGFAVSLSRDVVNAFKQALLQSGFTDAQTEKWPFEEQSEHGSISTSFAIKVNRHFNPVDVEQVSDEIETIMESIFNAMRDMGCEHEGGQRPIVQNLSYIIDEEINR